MRKQIKEVIKKEEDIIYENIWLEYQIGSTKLVHIRSDFPYRFDDWRKRNSQELYSQV